MPEIKNTFMGGRMNKDLDERLIPNNEYRDAMNIQVSTSEESHVGALQNILGNKKLNGQEAIPDGSYCVGSISDEKDNSVYWLVNGNTEELTSLQMYNLLQTRGKYLYKDLILKYNIDSGGASTAGSDGVELVFLDVYKIALPPGILSSGSIHQAFFSPDIGIKVGMSIKFINKTSGLNILPDGLSVKSISSSGTVTFNKWINIATWGDGYFLFSSPRVLNFNKKYPITGINIIDDLLFWTDNNSEPKKIHIPRSIEGTDLAFRLTQNGNLHTNLIVEDRSITNTTNTTLIEEQHITVIKKAPQTPPVLDLTGLKELASGTYPFTLSFYDTGTGLLYEVGKKLTVNLGTNVNVSVGDILLFNPVGSGTLLPYNYQVRVRITEDMTWEDPYGNIVQAGYWKFEILSILDTTDSTTSWRWMVEIEEEEKIFERRFPRFAYRYKYKDGEYSTFSPFSEIAFSTSIFDYHPSKAYNLGMQNTLISVIVKDFITPQTPDDVVQVDILYKETNSPVVYVVDKIKKTDAALDHGSNNWDLNEYKINSDIIYSVVPSNQLLRSWDNVPRLALAQEITANRLVYGNYLQNYNLDVDYGKKPHPEAYWKSKAHDWGNYGEKSVKSNREYNIGITYVDYYGRETPVFTNKDASIRIPFEQSSENNKLTVKNKTYPPPWAKYWKIYIKETSNEYYNLVMDRVYRAQDGNLWLSFPSSDRNKVDEETFLILKKSTDSHTAITQTNTYKCIAIENEAPDFIKTRILEVGDSKGTSLLTVSINGTATTVSCINLFTYENFRPGEDKYKIRMKIATWDETEIPLGDIKEPMSMIFTATTSDGLSLYSERYKVVNFALADHGIGTPPEPKAYAFTLDRAIEEDWLERDATASWLAAPNAGLNIFEPGLGVIIYKHVVENKPEFDGRFFVKINNDQLIDDEIAPLINRQDTTVIIQSLSVNYLADADAIASVGHGVNTTGVNRSTSPGHWANNTNANLKFGGTTPQSKWFIDQTYIKAIHDDVNSQGSSLKGSLDEHGTSNVSTHYDATVDNHPENSAGWYNDHGYDFRKGIYEEIDANGKSQWYMDISFSKVGPTLHDGTVDWQDFLSPSQSGWDNLMQGINTEPGSLDSKFGVGISANQDHVDEKDVVAHLITGSRFRFSGDASGTIYTITNTPEITYHLNHTDKTDFYYSPQSNITNGTSLFFGTHALALIDSSSNMGSYNTSYQTYIDQELTLKNWGAPHNRRTTYKIPINKNPFDQPWNPITGSDPASRTNSINLDFVGFYSTDTDNQLQSTNPAIWETEPKENIDLDIYYEAGQAYPVKTNKSNSTQYIPIGSTFRCDDCTHPTLDYIVTGFDGKYITFDFLDKISYPALPNTNIPADSILVFNSMYGGTVSATVIGMVSGHIVEINPYVAKESITVDWYNCYSFGNGVESDRIRDDFNQVTIDNGAVASSITEYPYEEERRKYGLIYSGIYNSISGINNLNQFVMAEKITKDLNPTYGSIQKLFQRRINLVALCEDRVLKIIAGKDTLYNADGSPQLIASSAVLGDANPFVGDWGISKNPESFASESYRAYFTDRQRGAVLRLSMDGLTPISDNGMHDWFRDNLKLSDTITGGFDNFKKEYNVTLPDVVEIGGVNINKQYTVSFGESTKGWISFKSFIPENSVSSANNYYTFKDGNIWQHHIETDGGVQHNRNTFYGDHANSHVECVLNISPEIVKSFDTLSYEGSQSRVDQFIEYVNPRDYKTYTDKDYHNLELSKKGWYVENIITDAQDGTLKEFIEKEGKWFNYIKGKEISTTSSGNIVAGLEFDPSEFSWQGIDRAELISTAPTIGCTVSTAINYNSYATVDDGSCIGTVYGCTNPNASNYDSTATFDDGSCTILGCIDPTAFNYNPNATINDPNNPCIPFIYGCTDVTMFNYDSAANSPCDSNFSGCTTVANSNIYNVAACTGPDNGSNTNGCCEPLVYGCTDSAMFNYNPLANTIALTVHDGTGPCIPFIYGCTNHNATNYNIDANTDDGSCIYAMHSANFYINALNQIVLEIIPNSNAPGGGEFMCEIFEPASTFVLGQQTSTPVSGLQQFVVPCNLLVGTGADGTGSGTWSSTVNFSWPQTSVPEQIFNFQLTVVTGCMDPNATNYNCATSIHPNSPTPCTGDNPNVDDCTCIGCVYGCTDTDGTLNSAHNWTGTSGTNCTGILPNNHDPSATCENGTCEYWGCNDPNAINYSPCYNRDCAGQNLSVGTTGHDSSCCVTLGCDDSFPGCYPDINGHCPGNNTTGNTVGQPSCGPGGGYAFSNFNPAATANSWTDADGTVHKITCKGEIVGCTDKSSYNYDPCATLAGLNVCVPIVSGCTDVKAENYGSYSSGSQYGPYVTNTNNGQTAPLGNTGNVWDYDFTANPGPQYDIVGGFGPNQLDSASCVYSCCDTSFDTQTIDGKTKLVFSLAPCDPFPGVVLSTSALVTIFRPDCQIYVDQNGITWNQNNITVPVFGLDIVIDSAAIAASSINVPSVCPVSLAGSWQATVQFVFITPGTGGAIPPCTTTVTKALVAGCTESNATNYNPLATVDDGSCIFTVAKGCQPCNPNIVDCTANVTRSNPSGCLDCNCDNCDQRLGWLGDGYCDDGSWGINFNCAAFNYDNGDCGSNFLCLDEEIISSTQSNWHVRYNSSVPIGEFQFTVDNAIIKHQTFAGGIVAGGAGTASFGFSWLSPSGLITGVKGTSHAFSLPLAATSSGFNNHSSLIVLKLNGTPTGLSQVSALDTNGQPISGFSTTAGICQ